MRIAFVVAYLLVAAAAHAQEPAEWRLSQTALVSIGSVDGDERYTLNDVRGVLVLRDGRIVLRENNRLRVYHADGRHAADWGRDGEGPGEYRHIEGFSHYRGDSLAIYDMGLHRITILDSKGNYGRAVRMPLTYVRRPGFVPGESCCTFVGAFDDGSFVAAPPDMTPNTPGPHRWSLYTFYRIAADGSRADSIGTWGGELSAYDAKAPNKIRQVYYSPNLSYVTGGNRLFVGNGATWSISVVEPRGNSTRVLRPITTNRPLAPVTREMRRELEDDIRRSFAKDRSMIEGTLDDYLRGQFAQTVPAYRRLLPDAEGNLWVFQPADEPTKTHRFDVFDRAGRNTATMAVPARGGPMAITATSMVFIESDANNVEYLRVYRIEKR